MPVRLICVHHRLAGRTGHRYHEALGLLAEARRRGMEPLLFMNEDAEAAVRMALPDGRSVLRDPVFRPDLSFDQRTAAFVALLHRHVDPEVRRDDRLLLTVATQCEARALAGWVTELPESKRPWTVVLFPSDRWNRSGAAERNRQVREFQVVASELAGLGPAARRLIFCAHTAGLRGELTSLLGTEVLLAPMAQFAEGMRPVRAPTASGPPQVAVLGGARPEKGFHLLPAIVRASRARTEVEFLLQVANEQLPDEAFAELSRLAEEPGVRIASGPLDRPAYLSLLDAADLVLLPYQRIPYRQRPSGIFAEAVLAGLPVVVPGGTWMAEQVEAGVAAGMVFAELDPEAIAAALAACVADLPQLATQARERAPAWARTQTITSFLDWVEDEITLRGRAAGAPAHLGGGMPAWLSSATRRLKASIRAWARG
ncbi:MAG TPA: glycosyltransferase [Thermoanaerobaculia bacterium]|nr:glycosyltransferase [Thermoanaerobaculia bacterium]